MSGIVRLQEMEAEIYDLGGEHHKSLKTGHVHVLVGYIESEWAEKKVDLV